MSFKPNIGETIEPGSMAIRDAIKYKGKDWQKLSSTGRNFRRAIPGMLGPVIGVALFYPFLKSVIKHRIYGDDGKGGPILNIATKYTNHDIEYTREFQNMRFMQESLFQNNSKSVEFEQNLKKENVKLPELSLRFDIKKEAPHHKYF